MEKIEISQINSLAKLSWENGRMLFEDTKISEFL